MSKDKADRQIEEGLRPELIEAHFPGKGVRTMNARTVSTAAIVRLAALLLISAPALAATAPNLGTAAPFGIVAGSTYTNTAAGTTVNGNICYTTAPAVPATSLNPPVVPCTPQILLTDLPNALADLNAQALAATCTPIGAAVDLSLIAIGGGTPGVFPPGCYSSTGAMSIGSTLTLNGNGIYIFKPNGALNTAAGSIVTLAGACAGNVFWGPTATTLGANSIFAGNILDDTSTITLGNLAVLTGRALAFGVGGTVATSRNTITVPGACAALPPPTLTQVPTLSEWAMITLSLLLAFAGFAALRRRNL
ncbi:MAG: IPTL-CTERM sorting domain-containing protein [Usitatibacter sp.]